jgi:transcriptional regulator with XRE-family HTH domain
METLRQYRKRKGLTLADLAPKIGVTEGQLSRIETTGKASLKTALAIQEETGVPATCLAPVEGRAA